MHAPTKTISGWLRAKRASPCPVCNAPDWCAVSDNGAVAMCMRVADGAFKSQPNATGLAHFHRLTDRPFTPPPPKPKPRTGPTIDWQERWQQARDEVQPGELYDYSDAMLGLSGEGLDLLEAGFIDDELVTPERDAGGRIIGLLRRTRDGVKLAMAGSQRGLCYQHPFPDIDPVMVCEGPSDTAALIEAGFNAVGRPSNTGGGELLAEMLKGRAVVVLGENDRKPDGTWPGRDGVEATAPHLRPVCSSVKVAYPPEGIKDVRAWMRGAE